MNHKLMTALVVFGVVATLGLNGCKPKEEAAPVAPTNEVTAPAPTNEAPVAPVNEVAPTNAAPVNAAPTNEAPVAPEAPVNKPAE
jgi:hypothetical protein